MNITIIGGGRIGLPAAACFAKLGYKTVCCEQDSNRRTAIADGRAPFADDGLNDAVAAGVASGMLQVCANISEAAAKADAIFIAVPVSNGTAGTDILHSVAREAAAVAPEHCILVIKSTAPPGACAQLDNVLERKIPVAYNPEFLRQGFGFRDFMSPSRIVAGTDDAHSARVLQKIYAPLVKRGAKYIATSRASAEISKLAANIMLSSRVALINEISDLCEAANGGIDDVTKILSMDKRIGDGFLRAGTGFGGACLPKDARILSEAAQRTKVAMPATVALLQSNAAHIERIAARIIAPLPTAPVIAVWGVAFKPDADDICESPAAAMVQLLQKNGAKINGYDAMISEQARNKMPAVRWRNNALDTLADADMLAVLTGHSEFARVSATDIKATMKGKRVFDCAGVFNRTEMEQAGLDFFAIGGR